MQNTDSVSGQQIGPQEILGSDSAEYVKNQFGHLALASAALPDWNAPIGGDYGGLCGEHLTVRLSFETIFNTGDLSLSWRGH
jgi:hypothetical protein